MPTSFRNSKIAFARGGMILFQISVIGLKRPLIRDAPPSHHSQQDGRKFWLPRNDVVSVSTVDIWGHIAVRTAAVSSKHSPKNGCMIARGLSFSTMSKGIAKIGFIGNALSAAGLTMQKPRRWLKWQKKLRPFGWSVPTLTVEQQAVCLKETRDSSPSGVNPGGARTPPIRQICQKKSNKDLSRDMTAQSVIMPPRA